MRAVIIGRYGPPDVLVETDLPVPEPAAGQLLVRVAAAGVNFIDTQLRAGHRAPPEVTFPLVLGNEVGGTVVGTGPGVDPDLTGSCVVASLRGSGGYAEQVVADAAAAIQVPVSLPVGSAVALVAQGRTALGVMREARVAGGERVLVEAAAGGVGSLLVQLARAAGAGVVVAAAGGAEKLRLAAELGAHATVDYRRPGWDEQVRAATGGGVDVVFESVGGEIGRTGFELLSEGTGRIVVFGYSSGTVLEATAAEATARGVTIIGFGGARMRRPGYPRLLVTEALAAAAAGVFAPVIGQTFPLGQAAEAHAAVEGRNTTGKTLLVP